MTVLACDDPSITTYDDLMIACYQDPEVAGQILSDQIKFMEMGLEKIEADPSILNIVIGRDLILHVLKRGMKDTKEELLTNVDVIFKARS